MEDKVEAVSQIIVWKQWGKLKIRGSGPNRSFKKGDPRRERERKLSKKKKGQLSSFKSPEFKVRLKHGQRIVEMQKQG